jgi:hypothetical protein
VAWPTTAVGTGDLITAAQLNGLPVMIANTTLSGDVASIDFQSIPAHYAHLMLVCYLRGSTASASLNCVARFNNDSGANYDHQYVRGLAATASAVEVFADIAMVLGLIPGSTAGGNLFGGGTIVVPHYANSANNKSSVAGWGIKAGTASSNLAVQESAGFWRSNSAINRVTILAATGNLVTGSRITLYGLA